MFRPTAYFKASRIPLTSKKAGKAFYYGARESASDVAPLLTSATRDDDREEQRKRAGAAAASSNNSLDPPSRYPAHSRLRDRRSSFTYGDARGTGALILSSGGPDGPHLVLTSAEAQARWRHAFSAAQSDEAQVGGEGEGQVEGASEGDGGGRGKTFLAEAGEEKKERLASEEDENAVRNTAEHDHDTPSSASPAPTPSSDTPDRRPRSQIRAEKEKAGMRRYRALMFAAQRRDVELIKKEVSAFRKLPVEEQDVTLFNMAIEALVVVHNFEDPLTPITDIYSDMLNKDVQPNKRTFSLILEALAKRDIELSRMHAKAQSRKRTRAMEAALLGQGKPAQAGAVAEEDSASVSDDASEFDDTPGSWDVEQLYEKHSKLDEALRLFTAISAERPQPLSLIAYNCLLNACAKQGRFEDARRVFARLEADLYVSPDPHSYGWLLSAYARAGHMKDARFIFDEFRAFFKEEYESDKYTVKGRNVWERMITALFSNGDSAGAVALVEEMVGSLERKARGEQLVAGDPPVPTAMTYYYVIRGFLDIGDYDTAVKWFDRLQAVLETSPMDVSIPRPDENLFNLMIEHLSHASPSHVDEVNRIFHLAIERAPVDNVKLRVGSCLAVIRANACASDAALEAGDTALANVMLDKALQAEETFDRYYSLQTSAYRKFPNTYGRILIERLVALGRIDNAVKVFCQCSVRVYDDSLVHVRRPRVAHFLHSAASILGIKLDDDFERVLEVHDRKPTADFLTLISNSLFPPLRFPSRLPPVFGQRIAQIYTIARSEANGDAKQLALPSKAWSLILHAYTALESLKLGDASAFAAPAPVDLVPFETMLKDLAAVEGQSWHISLTHPARVLVRTRGKEAATEMLAAVDPALAENLRSVQPLPAAAAATATADQTESVMAPSSSDALSSASDVASQETTLTSPPRSPDVDGGDSRQQHELDATTELPADATTEPPADATTTPFFPTQTFADLPAVNIVDPDLANWLDLHSRPWMNVNADQAYDQLKQSVSEGVYPTPESLARLINSLGRGGKLDRVQELYQIGQHLVTSLASDATWQSQGWLAIEDSMIIALAHGGQPEAANMHRIRIRDAGGAPSADAYAALVNNVRDTTDDASVARDLFEESQHLGVRPNVFLFNTVISKLSRARKADVALDLFQQMKQAHLRPTSVTYGALINAVARIGDEQMATQLFNDMVSLPNFKPRVPPYNTMMQFYIHGKPDRERVLHYFDALLKAGVSPSAHTYKLLMDAYGTIEPVDSDSLSDVFERLVADPKERVQGTHWGSLIYSWGCVKKDLEKAREIFDSIATHPSTIAQAQQGRDSVSPLPDAVAFEALLNVFVAHHRTDLIPEYVDRLKKSGVHMTAYIANLLIRGYAADNKIDEARAIFESMADAPAGHAAPGNHVGKSTSSSDGSSIPPRPDGIDDEVVFREPSTYEVMVRAELGTGNRDRAQELVKRLDGRGLPPALVVRISSLLGDEPPQEPLPAGPAGEVAPAPAPAP